MTQFLMCDAAGCDHLEQHAEGLHSGLINKPCPKCGSNLLTEQDWRDWSSQVAPLVKAMIDAGFITDAKPGDTDAALTGFHVHAGKLHIQTSLKAPELPDGVSGD